MKQNLLVQDSWRQQVALAKAAAVGLKLTITLISLGGKQVASAEVVGLSRTK